MKKSIVLFTFILFISYYTANSQSNKHIVGLSAGITMPWENGIYIDYSQYNIWPDNKANPSLSMFYEYKVLPFFKIGCHLDYENSKVEITYPFDEDIKTRRVAIGFHWIGQYPDTKIHAELGGFSNMAFASSDAWDANMKGVEYGIIVGPAISFNEFKIALHFQPTFSYFFSNDNPESVLLLYPRILCKLHYTLK